MIDWRTPRRVLGSLEELPDLVAAVRAAPVVAIDTETTGLSPFNGDTLLGVAIGTPSGAWYVPLSVAPLPSLYRLFNALNQVPTIVMHNALFDLVFLHGTGLNVLPERLHDTMVVDWLMDENLPHGLKDIARRLWGPDAVRESDELRDLLRKHAWGELPLEKLGPYAAADAALTLALYDWQTRHPAWPHLREAYERERRVLFVALQMVRNGIAIDQDLAHDRLRECELAAAEIEKRYPDVNLRSPVQVADLLFGRLGLSARGQTPTGQPRTDAATLQALIEEHAVVRDLVRYRRLTKLASAFFRPLATCGSIVHPWFKPWGTRTGRWSCSDPNLQQLPRDSTAIEGFTVRDLFVPRRPGYVLRQYDLDQAELRVAAHYAKDEAFVAALESGDVHGAVAEALFGSQDEPNRTVGKTLNFSALYGAGPVRLAQTARRAGLRLTEDEARQLLTWYRRHYPGLHAVAQRVQAAAEERGWIPIYPPVPARRRRFRGPTYALDARLAWNSLVQGGVAELVKDWVVALSGKWADRDALPVLQVHDALVFELPRVMVAEWDTAVQQALQDVNPFSVPMRVAAKPWSDES